MNMISRRIGILGQTKELERYPVYLPGDGNKYFGLSITDFYFIHLPMMFLSTDFRATVWTRYNELRLYRFHRKICRGVRGLATDSPALFDAADEPLTSFLVIQF